MSLQLEVKELASYVQRNKVLYCSAIAKHPRTFNSLKYRKYWPHSRGVSTNDFSNITGLRRGPHDIGTQIYCCKVFGGEAAHSYTGVAHSLTDFGKTSVLGKKYLPCFLFFDSLWQVITSNSQKLKCVHAINFVLMMAP